MSPRTASALVLARRVGIVLLFVVVLVRPGFGRAEAPVQLTDLDVVVVVDRTRSMAALDHDGEPRIRGAQADLVALGEALPGARFAMLAFGTDARVVMPLSSDTAAFEAAVETLELEGPKDGVGSRADRPVPELTDLLERAEEAAPERRRVVVYVGDGEDTTSEGEDRSFDGLRQLVAGGAVLGYGTSDGAPMPQDDELDGSLGYVQDPATGDTAVSKADLDRLREIADQLDVPFEHRTGPGGIEAIADSFAAAYADGEGGHRRAAHDLTWVAALLLLALLLVELHAGWRAAWTSRRALAPAVPGDPTRREVR